MRIPRIRLVGQLTSLSEVAISLPNATAGDMAPIIPHQGTDRFHVPSSSVRGAIRAGMNDVLHEKIKEGKHPPMSYLNIARNAVGGVKGSKKGMLPPAVIVALLDENPIFDAVGGGEPVFAEGRVKVGDIISVEAAPTASLRNGVRADPFRRKVELGMAPLMSDPEAFSRIVEINAEVRPWTAAAKALASKKKSEKDGAIPKLEKATGLSNLTAEDVGAKVATLMAERMALGGSDNSLLMPLPETKVIPQGDFTQRIDICRAHDHTVGMIIEGLISMAKAGFRFGGLKSKGLGEFTAQYRVDVLNDLVWVEDCTIVINGDDAVFDIVPVAGKTLDQTLIAQCRVAFEEAFSSGLLDFTFKGFDAIIPDNDADEDETDEGAANA